MIDETDRWMTVCVLAYVTGMWDGSERWMGTCKCDARRVIDEWKVSVYKSKWKWMRSVWVVLNGFLGNMTKTIISMITPLFHE